MHGCGNDFVVVDNRNNAATLEQWIAWTPQLCDRRYGVGADGLLLLQRSDISDFTMIYRNADGSDAGMCGNGGRCIAAFASGRGFGTAFTFDVHGKKYSATIMPFSDTEFVVDLSFPVTVKPEMRRSGVEEYAFAYTGTEHLVVPSTSGRLKQSDWLRKRGSELRNNLTLSKTGANVNFVARDTDGLHVQTFERGVEDLTLACGTGALASVIVDHFLTGRRDSLSAEPIHCAGGSLFVSFDFLEKNREYKNLVLSGPSKTVFHGSTHL